MKKVQAVGMEYHGANLACVVFRRMSHWLMFNVWIKKNICYVVLCYVVEDAQVGFG